MFNNKKWIIISMCFLAGIFVLIINQFIKITYDLSLYEYIKYSQDLSQKEIAYLKEKKALRYTLEKNAPPFSFKDTHTGLYKGFVVDYASALSIELNIDIELIPMNWKEAIENVASGEADITELHDSYERRRLLDFTQSLYTFKVIIITRKDQQDIKTAEDLTGHRVAIEAADYSNEFINNNIAGVEIINTVDYLEAIHKLLKGEVDAVTGDEPIMLHFTKNLGVEEELNILNEPLCEIDICLGVKKNSTELVNVLNKGILNLKKSNFATKIQQKWYGLSALTDRDRISIQIMFFLIVFLILMAAIATLASIWNYILKRQVNMRTEELDESRNDLQKIFDTISNYLIIINDKGCIENLNKSYLDWLQKEKDDIIGRSYKDLPLLDSINIDNTGTDNEVVYKGRYYNYYINSFEYEKHRILLSIQDNTNEIISSKQMIHQNKMIAIGQLASGLAHEIRNPLGIIRNYCYILKNKLSNQDELIKESISSIESSVSRAGKIVESQLNFSRTNDYAYKLVVLRDVIEDIVLLEKKSITDKEIIFHLDCDPEVKVYTKIESFTHIILNLLSNAVDAVEQGGSITIKCYKDNDNLYIDLSDNGGGIKQQDLEYIFNPFFTTKKAGKGNGLGLYIVYNELQKINGNINVESCVGKGTKFSLKFKLGDNKDD